MVILLTPPAVFVFAAVSAELVPLACPASGGRRIAVGRLGTAVRDFRLEAFERGPGLNQSAVNGEMIIRQERGDLLVRQDRGHQLFCDVGVEQPIAVLREHRRHPDRLVDR
jgi:hypothetical protein